MIDISSTAMSVARVITEGPKSILNRGVGFFMKLGPHTVFVSNRHVIHPFDTLTIEIPLIGKTVLSAGSYKCLPHKETDVDLAIVIVDRLKEDDPAFWARIEQFVLPETCIVSRNDVVCLPVLQEVAAVTMLYDLKFDGVFAPVVRKGLITSPIGITRDLVFTDLFCISGNSGSPVFLLPYDGAAPHLLAVVRQKIDDKGKPAGLTLCQNAYGLLDFHRWF